MLILGSIFSKLIGRLRGDKVRLLSVYLWNGIGV